MITYFKSQKDMVNTLIPVIDSYWNNEISESDFIDYLLTVYRNNIDKFKRSNGEIPSAVKQRLGKKRVQLIDKILNSIENKEGIKE